MISWLTDSESDFEITIFLFIYIYSIFLVYDIYIFNNFNLVSKKTHCTMGASI